MAASINDFNNFGSLSLSGQYDSLHANFDELNNKFDAALDLRVDHSRKNLMDQEEEINNTLRSLHAGLISLSRQMRERTVTPLHQKMQETVDASVAQRAKLLKERLIPCYSRAPEAGMMSSLSFLPIPELSAASSVCKAWRTTCKKTLDAMNVQVTKVSENEDTQPQTSQIYEMAYKLVSCNALSKAQEILQANFDTTDSNEKTLDIFYRLIEENKITLAHNWMRLAGEGPRPLMRSKLVEVYVERNQIDLALEVTREATNDSEISRFLSFISLELRRKIQFNRALEVTRLFPEERAKSWDMKSLIEALISENKFADASKLFNEITDQDAIYFFLKSKSSTLLLKAGFIEETIQLALKLSDMGRRNQSLAIIFNGLLQSLNTDRAFAFLKKFNDGVVIWNLADLHNLALLLADINEIQRAYEVAEIIDKAYNYEEKQKALRNIEKVIQ